jgi:FkbM family methyltransferase
MGWSGVIVEPSPVCIKPFIKEYENEDKIVLINKAVSDSDGMITFFESNGDAVGTSDVDHMKKWGNGGIEYSEISVPAISMESLLKEYGSGVKFLSLDTEATNIKLFDLLPDWFLNQLDMICIEHDGEYDYILDRLEPFGYQNIYQNSENIICAKDVVG